MKEKLKAAMILLLICIGGVIVPQIGGVMNKDWADVLSFVSVFGAIIAFLGAFALLFQDR